MFNFDFTLTKYEELCQTMVSSEYVPSTVYKYLTSDDFPMPETPRRNNRNRDNRNNRDWCILVDSDDTRNRDHQSDNDAGDRNAEQSQTDPAGDKLGEIA